MVEKLPCAMCHKWQFVTDYGNTQDWPACNHWDTSVCHDCITKHIETAADTEPIEKLPCPEPKCRGHLGFFQMQQYAPAPIFERYEHKVNVEAFTDDLGSLSLSNEKFINCSSSDCDWACIVDNGHVTSWIRCQKCGAETCVSCLQAWHSGKPCGDGVSAKPPQATVGQASSPKTLESEKPKKSTVEDVSEAPEKPKSEAKAEPLFKKCPKCRARIEKSGGCGHMICPMCRFHFCWDCGADYDEILAKEGSAGHKPGCRWHTEPGFLAKE